MKSYQIRNGQNQFVEICKNIQLYAIMVEQIKRSLFNFFVQIANRIIEFFKLLFSNSLTLSYEQNSTKYVHNDYIIHNHPHQYLKQPLKMNDRLFSHKGCAYQSPNKHRVPQFMRKQENKLNKYNSHDKYYKISEQIMPINMLPINSPRIYKKKQRLQFTQEQSDYRQYNDNNYVDIQQEPSYRGDYDNHYSYGVQRLSWRSIDDSVLKSSKSLKSIQKLNKFDYRRFAKAL